MSKAYLASLSAVNSIPLQTPATQIQRDLEEWLAQGNQVKCQPVSTAANHDYSRGKPPMVGTAAYRVLQMLEGAKELGEAVAGGGVMVEVDIRKDQFMSLMRYNTGFCDVLHSMGELKKGDLVSECGFVFVVDRVVKGDRMDRVWLKKRGQQ